MKMQQQTEINFEQMEKDLIEIKMGVLEFLKKDNPKAYLYYFNKINSKQLEAN